MLKLSFRTFLEPYMSCRRTYISYPHNFLSRFSHLIIPLKNIIWALFALSVNPVNRGLPESLTIPLVRISEGGLREVS